MIILDDSISKESVSVYYGKAYKFRIYLTKHKSVYFKKLLAVYVLYIITFR